MSKWVDNLPNKWYYNEIEEAGNIYLEDDKPLLEGMSYNAFEEGAPFIYKELKALPNQKDFILDKVIIPTVDNPLYVYINGVQTVYKNVVVEGTTTRVTMFQEVGAGAIIAFASYGKAKVDVNGRPTSVVGDIRYPNYKLLGAINYVHSTYNSQYAEYVYAAGRQLKRITIPLDEWNADPFNRQKVLRKHMTFKPDIYFIAPDGIIHIPYNLNNVTCKIIYTTNEGFLKRNTEEFVATTPTVLFLNRVFPEAKINRSEAFALINRLRNTFYSRFTDVEASSHNLDTVVIAYGGQRAVSVQGSYIMGSDELEVWLNGKKQRVDRDYVESDNYTIVFDDYLDDGDIVEFKANRTRSVRLEDVGTTTYYTNSTDGSTFTVNGTIGNENPELDSWWAPHILALEQELLSSGENMVDGVPVSADGLNMVVNSNMEPLPGGDLWFMPNSFMTRAQAVTIINRFRKLCLEKFL